MFSNITSLTLYNLKMYFLLYIFQLNSAVWGYLFININRIPYNNFISFFIIIFFLFISLFLNLK